MKEHADGVGYCILHNPDTKKDTTEFREGVRRLLEMQSLKAQKEAQSLREGQRLGWEHRTDYRYVVFPDGYSFEGSQFEGEGVDFSNATFGEKVDFRGVRFLCRTDFGGAKFGRGTSFRGAEFPDYAWFRNCTCEPGVSFRDATFGNGIDFRHSEFGDGVNFWKAEFGAGADFLEATFSDEANFTEAIFAHRPIFTDTTFGDRLRFDKAKLGEEPQFIGTTIGNEADFHETTFGDEMRFVATVGDDADFNDIVVGTGSQWAMGSFGDSTRFAGAQFKGFAYFREVTFGDGADFSRAVFEDKLEMVKMEFGETATFKATEFLGRVTMRGENHDRLFSRRCASPTQAKFIDAAFSEPDKVAFRYADLRRTQFIHADIRKIEFTSVTWPRIQGGYGVHDEEVYEKSDDAYPYGALARLYRRLKQNYEDQRDYGRGGDFHYREKEMMRENPRTPKPTRIVLWLYWAFSGYGERLRAGWFLVSLIVFYAFGSLTLGLEEKMNGTWERLPCNSSELIDSLTHGLAHSLQVALLRKPTSTQPATPESEIVQVAVMILGPLLLGLFALAIPQRVRR
jgi:uncharacterized protein YjbI with pentapeptide repeats